MFVLIVFVGSACKRKYSNEHSPAGYAFIFIIFPVRLQCKRILPSNRAATVWEDKLQDLEEDTCHGDNV
jgi:hypothetical protein